MDKCGRCGNVVVECWKVEIINDEVVWVVNMDSDGGWCKECVVDMVNELLGDVYGLVEKVFGGV